MKIPEVHDELSDRQLVFLDSELNPVKIKSIKKVPFKGKIYDVDVPNDLMVVRRHNETTRKPQITQDYIEGINIKNPCKSASEIKFIGSSCTIYTKKKKSASQIEGG